MGGRKKPAAAARKKEGGGVVWFGGSAAVVAIALVIAMLSQSSFFGSERRATTEQQASTRANPQTRLPHGHPLGGMPKGCSDGHESCAAWAEAGDCKTNQEFMATYCGRSCGTCEVSAAPAERKAPTKDPRCADKNVDECGAWAAMGECDANPGYMLVSCASSCNMCEMLDYKKRCAVDESVPLTVPPGAIAETFRLAASDRFAELQPQLLSSNPPVLMFDAFLSDEEADALVAGGRQKGWVVSEDAGKMLPDGSFEAIRSSHRTSMTAWCDTAECQAIPHLQRVMERAENVTRVPQANSEFVQVLQYGVGQYYGGHHDFIPAHSKLPCGPRVYTLFFYLSDVEAGGETTFDRLGIVAKPKKGRALLWPSVFDDRPLVQDHRTFHEAKPVKSGVKYAANLWLHQKDFKAAHRLGCSG